MHTEMTEYEILCTYYDMYSTTYNSANVARILAI